MVGLSGSMGMDVERAEAEQRLIADLLDDHERDA